MELYFFRPCPDLSQSLSHRYKAMDYWRIVALFVGKTFSARICIVNPLRRNSASSVSYSLFSARIYQLSGSPYLYLFPQRVFSLPGNISPFGSSSTIELLP